MSAKTASGLTVRDVARRYRVGEDRVRQWIKSGQLPALNTRDSRSGRPRFVVTPEALAEWEQSRRVVTPPKPARRKKRTMAVDFYPD